MDPHDGVANLAALLGGLAAPDTFGVWTAYGLGETVALNWTLSAELLHELRWLFWAILREEMRD